MRIIDKCQWTYLKGGSCDHCTEAKSEEAFLMVHEEATSGIHAPLFWAKFHHHHHDDDDEEEEEDK